MIHILQAFALHSYILLYTMILLGDTEGLDQPAQMHRLILAVSVRKFR